MARDRKRARQRRRPAREPAEARLQQPVRADLPGALEHAGDVDEFDAALVRGADGVSLEQDERSSPSGNGAAAPAPAPQRDGPSTGGRGRGAIRRGEADAELEEAFAEGVPVEEALTKRPPSQPVRVRAIAFLRASWAELQRVQWPDRPHVTQATTVVIGFLVVAGVYLGAADWVAQKIVNFIL